MAAVAITLTAGHSSGPSCSDSAYSRCRPKTTLESWAMDRGHVNVSDLGRWMRAYVVKWLTTVTFSDQKLELLGNDPRQNNLSATVQAFA